jgi:hypothetical protein
MKFLRVTMPDGSQYDVPAYLIASNRATYYAECDTGETSGPEFDKIFKIEFDYAMACHDEIVDWAANNMNWSNVSGDSERVGGTLSPEDFQEGWLNGDKEIVDK